VAQAQRIRDSRGMPEFVFNPMRGEIYAEALDLKGNPSPKTDWWEAKHKATKEKYRYTVAHWCATEARFRRHLKKVKEADLTNYTHLDDILPRLTFDDVVHRRFLGPDHRSFVPDFGVYIATEVGEKVVYQLLSRQMVLFCVERRKAWRLLQSKAGIENLEYRAQRQLLKKVDAGDIPLAEFLANVSVMLRDELAGDGGAVPAKSKAAPGETVPSRA
jgi:pyruvate-ferredoxin/flavodoxin oxidoreductase